jgi:uncharacterized protein (DUF433 family)
MPNTPYMNGMSNRDDAPDDLIVSDPEIMGGTPCIEGTRLTVYAVAARIRGGETIAELFDLNSCTHANSAPTTSHCYVTSVSHASSCLSLSRSRRVQWRLMRPRRELRVACQGR